MAYRFYTADVFTDRIFGGNPLCVVPDGRGLSDAQMQAVAREFNLSETVFVLPPADPAHTRRLRIFTPATELPFAGHPTVGTAHILAEIGAIELRGASTSVVFEEGVGPVPVTIRSEAGKPVFAQLSAAKMPEFGPSPPDTREIAAMLSLSDGEILADPAPRAVSCGVPFLFVSLTGLDAARRVRLDRARWASVLAGYWAPQIFVICRETVSPGCDIHARMFAPAAGIDEDPATGAAATALAGYLAAGNGAGGGTRRWVVEQGCEMGRPSILEVEADLEGDAIVAIRVGGAAVTVTSGEIRVPPLP